MKLIKPELKKFNSSLLKSISKESLTKIEDILSQHFKEDKKSSEDLKERIAKSLSILGLTEDKEREEKVYSQAAFSTLITASSYFSQIVQHYDVSIYDEITEEAEKIAQEKKKIFDYHFEEVEPLFFQKMENAFLWSALCGVSYVRVCLDPLKNLPYTQIIQPQKIWVSDSYYQAENASILTVEDSLGFFEFKQLCEDGTFLNLDKIELDDSSLNPYLFEENEIEEILNNISGFSKEDIKEKKEEGFLRQGIKIYTTYLKINLEKEDPFSNNELKDYKVVSLLSGSTPKIIYFGRNWINGSEVKKERVIGYSCLPSFNGAGYGFVQFGVSNADGANRLLNQIVSASIQANISSGFIDNTLRPEDTTVDLVDGKFLPVKSAGEDIKTRIYELKKAPPDQSLFTTKDILEGQISGVFLSSLKALQELPNQSRNPQILSILEKSERSILSIAQKIALSFTSHLKAYNDLFYQVSEKKTIARKGEVIRLTKAHFSPSLKILPSSDSVSQVSSLRFFIADLILNNAKEMPGEHKIHDVLKYYYTTIGVSADILESILRDPADDKIPERDALSENYCILKSDPIEVYPFQDHKAHVVVHESLGSNKSITEEQSAALQAHIQSHLAYEYLEEMRKKYELDLPDDPSKLEPEDQNKLTEKLAKKIEKEGKRKKEEEELPPISELQLKAQEVKLMQKYVEHEAHFKNSELTLKEQKLNLDAKEKELKHREREFELKTKAFVEENDLKLRLKESQDKLSIALEKNKIDQEKNEIEFLKIKESQKVAGEMVEQAPVSDPFNSEEELHSSNNLEETGEQ